MVIFSLMGDSNSDTARRAHPAVSRLSLGLETRALLERHGLAALKSMGQNFLTDRGVLDKILAAAAVGPEDTVVEVGPGLGVLTRALAERAGRVIAVELDRGMAALLRENFDGESNVAIVEGDILKTDIEALAGGAPYIVVANLPYYITSPALRHFLENPHPPGKLVVMVQKEVAQQITARPPEMSLLSIAVQFFGVPKLVSRVPAGAFYPPPRVDSALLRIDVLPVRRLSLEETAGFFKVARAGFATRRKQLVNALAGGLGIGKTEAAACLAAAGVDPSRRAETLSVEDWVALYRACRSAGA